jgi:hypothetical protein
MASTREGGVLVVQDGLWYEDFVVSAGAAGLTLGGLPSYVPLKDLRRVVIQALGDKVRWRADGTAPTATTGLRLSDGDILVYDGDPTKIQFIKDSTASIAATLFIHYFGVS